MVDNGSAAPFLIAVCLRFDVAPIARTRVQPSGDSLQKLTVGFQHELYGQPGFFKPMQCFGTTQQSGKIFLVHRAHTTGTDASQLVMPVSPLRLIVTRMRCSFTGSIFRPKLSA